MENFWESSKKVESQNLFDNIFLGDFSRVLFEKPITFNTDLTSPKKTWPGAFKLIPPSELPTSGHYRFLVDDSAKLWFAREGIPSMRTPSHFQMTGLPFGDANCLAAGNLKYGENGSVRITNKSGDFKPDSPSLIHFFAAIYFGQLAQKIGLDGVIKLELWRVPGHEKGCHKGILLWQQVHDWFEKLSQEDKAWLASKYRPETSGCTRIYSIEKSGRSFEFSSHRPEPYSKFPQSISSRDRDEEINSGFGCGL